MKWLLIILILIVAGWKAAVYLTNSNAGGTKEASDRQQAINPNNDTLLKDSTRKGFGVSATTEITTLPSIKNNVDTPVVSSKQIVAFAKTLMGVPYLYGSADPAKGFDCSGFITYVFTHFGINVPRSSIDFTNKGKEVSAAAAREGDLILFTGTDSTERFVGHMGIVISNTDSLRFIHATSGKQHSVTTTALNPYYKSRYVKTIRLLEDGQ